MSFPLAIIIPAYKRDFFYLTLESIANQTCKEFTLYIGDDNSPNNLYEIVEAFEKRIELVYHKFEQNIGAKNLVVQWKRCVDLSNKERWIWLFSDDDIMSPDCVETFYKYMAIYGESYSVIDFRMRAIDGLGKIISTVRHAPEVEPTAEMAYNLLMGKRSNCMPQHIFKKEVYNRLGGFVATDFAQAADFASSILLSDRLAVVTINSTEIFWRFSGINISSLAAGNKSSMINGHLQFIEWVLHYFMYLNSAIASPISYQMIKSASVHNLTDVLISHYGGIPRHDFIKLRQFLRRNFDFNRYDTFRFILNVNSRFWQTTKVLRRVKRLLRLR